MNEIILSQRNILDGKLLLRKLDNTEYKVTSACWLYYPERSQWQLVIASDFYDKNGPNKSYAFIQKELLILRSYTKIHIVLTLNDIMAVGILIRGGRDTLPENTYIYRFERFRWI